MSQHIDEVEAAEAMLREARLRRRKAKAAAKHAERERYRAQWRAGLERAIAACGGIVAFARKVGVTKQAVQSNWRQGVGGAVGCIPEKRVRKVAKVSGVPLHELRPDLFPPP